MGEEEGNARRQIVGEAFKKLVDGYRKVKGDEGRVPERLSIDEQVITKPKRPLPSKPKKVGTVPDPKPEVKKPVERKKSPHKKKRSSNRDIQEVASHIELHTATNSQPEPTIPSPSPKLRSKEDTTKPRMPPDDAFWRKVQQQTQTSQVIDDPYAYPKDTFAINSTGDLEVDRLLEQALTVEQGDPQIEPISKLRQIETHDIGRTAPAVLALYRITAECDPNLHIQYQVEKSIWRLLDEAGSSINHQQGGLARSQVPEDVWYQLKIGGGESPLIRWLALSIRELLQKPQKAYAVEASWAKYYLFGLNMFHYASEYLETKKWPAWNFPDQEALDDFENRLNQILEGYMLAHGREEKSKWGVKTNMYRHQMMNPEERMPLFNYLMNTGEPLWVTEDDPCGFWLQVDAPYLSEESMKQCLRDEGRAFERQNQKSGGDYQSSFSSKEDLIDYYCRRYAVVSGQLLVLESINHLAGGLRFFGI